MQTTPADVVPVDYTLRQLRIFPAGRWCVRVVGRYNEAAPALHRSNWHVDEMSFRRGLTSRWTRRKQYSELTKLPGQPLNPRCRTGESTVTEKTRYVVSSCWRCHARNSPESLILSPYQGTTFGKKKQYISLLQVA